MEKGEFIFVYGTLLKGERADLSRTGTQFGVSFMGTDYINGLLYHLGAYPGLKPVEVEVFDEKRPSVAGEVFRILDPSITSILDAYEGYPSLYNRRQVPSLRGRLVWVYTYNHPVRPEQQIITGDWRQPTLAC